MNTSIVDIYNNFRNILTFRNSLIFLLPLALIIGSAVVNFLLILIFFIFLYDLISEKNFEILKKYWIVSFFLFWIYIVLISFFFSGLDNSLKNSFSQIRFLTLALFIYQNLDNRSYPILIKIILLCLLFVGIDNNIQFYTGLDIFGFPAEQYLYQKRIFELDEDTKYVIGRLSGPFKDELIAGAFLSKLSFIVLFYMSGLFQKFKNFHKLYFILLTLFLLESIFITGERTSSIFFIFLIFILLINLISLKKAFTILVTLFIIISIFISNSKYLKLRVTDTINIVSEYNDSSYGRLANSSFQLWNENLLFGVGLKNYRIECKKLIDPIPNHRFQYCSSHPHNTFLELLSETGIIGFILYFLFIIFFFFENKINKNKSLRINFYGLKTFIILSLLPILPSGSLFTTWNATFFWMVIGLYFFLSKQKNGY